MPEGAHLPDCAPHGGFVPPRLFGILNLTPDSFSDGGRWTDVGTAVDHALMLHAAGADIIDVGGESTRPGARRVDPDVELRRVLPVIVELARLEIPVSIDTVNSVTAAAAVHAGAETVNDVSGGLLDSSMSHVVRDTGVDYIVMHWRGRADLPDRHLDPVTEVIDELRRRTLTLTDDGVDPSRIIIDPGLGFGKNPTTNFTILADIGRLHHLGHRILVGHSRKRFLQPLQPEHALDAMARDLPTAVVCALIACTGLWAVRVHDVALSKMAMVTAAEFAAHRPDRYPVTVRCNRAPGK